jgi:YHS domain-containing protein
MEKEPVMSNLCRILSLALLLGPVIVLVGCAKEAPPAAEPDVPSPPPPGEVSMDAADTSVEATLASLPADERAAVEAQVICPVSEHKLGGMGAPIKVTVDGRDVYICCESCKEPLLADPAKYLANLPAPRP